MSFTLAPPICPGIVLKGIAERYRDGYYSPDNRVLFDDLIDYLRIHCYKQTKDPIFRILRSCLQAFWEVFSPPPLTPYNPTNRLPCMHDSLIIAQKYAPSKADVQENKLLFESAFVAIRYILEIKRIGSSSSGAPRIENIGLLTAQNYPIKEFFVNYEQVREFYSRTPYYEEDAGLAYRKPRYPEGDDSTGLDELEKTELILFGNLMRVALPLILNLKSKRKPVTNIIESLVGGQDRKIQSGSGVTQFSRRRFTIFEDESGVMPVTNNRQSKFGADTVVSIMKAPKNKKKDLLSQVEEVCFDQGLNHSMNEIYSHQKEFPGGLEIETDEYSSINGKSVISASRVKKNGEAIAESVKFMIDLQAFDELDLESVLLSPRAFGSQSVDEFLGTSSSLSSSSASGGGHGQPIVIANLSNSYNNSNSNSNSNGNDNNKPDREISIRTLLRDEYLNLDDFYDAFSYDFADSLLFPDDNQLSSLKSEHNDLKIESQVVTEGDKNVTHRGISISRLVSNNPDHWNLIKNDPEIMEQLTGLIRRQTSDAPSTDGSSRSVSRLVSLNKLSSTGWTRSVSNRALSNSSSSVSFGHVFDSSNRGGSGSSGTASPNNNRAELTKRSDRDNDAYALGGNAHKKSSTEKYSFDELQ